MQTAAMQHCKPGCSNTVQEDSSHDAAKHQKTSTSPDEAAMHSRNQQCSESNMGQFSGHSTVYHVACCLCYKCLIFIITIIIDHNAQPAMLAGKLTLTNYHVTLKSRRE
jgi:hypothetical protein